MSFSVGGGLARPEAVKNIVVFYEYKTGLFMEYLGMGKPIPYEMRRRHFILTMVNVLAR